MKLWLIEVKAEVREEGPWYDVYRGHVIAAPYAKMARNMASRMCAGEGGQVWLDKRMSYVECIAAESKFDTPTVVLSDFNAG